MNRWLLGVFTLVACLSIGNALECYVCTNQAGNVGKCLKSIQTCEQDENVCMTEVRRASLPYWTRDGRKQFYVSKSCKPKSECERIKYANMKYCFDVWTQDWRCSNCCVGDRCNYVVFSGGNTPTISFTMLFAVVLTPLIGTWSIH